MQFPVTEWFSVSDYPARSFDLLITPVTEPARPDLLSMCCSTKTAPARWSRATGLGKLGADDLDTAGSPPTPPEAVFAEEIETWLAIRPIVQPELPIVWTPHNGTCSGGIAVESPST